MHGCCRFVRHLSSDVTVGDEAQPAMDQIDRFFHGCRTCGRFLSGEVLIFDMRVEAPRAGGAQFSTMAGSTGGRSSRRPTTPGDLVIL